MLVVVQGVGVQDHRLSGSAGAPVLGCRGGVSRSGTGRAQSRWYAVVITSAQGQAGPMWRVRRRAVRTISFSDGRRATWRASRQRSERPCGTRSRPVTSSNCSAQRPVHRGGALPRHRHDHELRQWVRTLSGHPAGILTRYLVAPFRLVVTTHTGEAGVGLDISGDVAR